MEASELALARRADTVVVVTDEERTVLQAAGIERIVVIPTLHEPAITQPRSFEASDGLLFIGNYNHTPNVDAVGWLCDEIMPRVWKRLPNVALTLVGCNPSQEVLQRQAERVRITGYVPDVAPYFERASLFVAALRYGAGHKGKVGQALSYGLPTVMTPIAAEGFAVKDGRDCLIAENADDFAAAIVSLYPRRRRTLEPILANGPERHRPALGIRHRGSPPLRIAARIRTGARRVVRSAALADRFEFRVASSAR